MKKLLYSAALVMVALFLSFAFMGCEGINNPELNSMTIAKLQAPYTSYATDASPAPSAADKAEIVVGKEITQRNLQARLKDPHSVSFVGMQAGEDGVECWVWQNNTNSVSASKVIRVYVMAKDGDPAFTATSPWNSTKTAIVVDVKTVGIPA